MSMCARSSPAGRGAWAPVPAPPSPMPCRPYAAPPRGPETAASHRTPPVIDSTRKTKEAAGRDRHRRARARGRTGIRPGPPLGERTRTWHRAKCPLILASNDDSAPKKRKRALAPAPGPTTPPPFLPFTCFPFFLVIPLSTYSRPPSLLFLPLPVLIFLSPEKSFFYSGSPWKLPGFFWSLLPPSARPPRAPPWRRRLGEPSRRTVLNCCVGFRFHSVVFVRWIPWAELPLGCCWHR
jgi:hypothetical protein